MSWRELKLHVIANGCSASEPNLRQYPELMPHLMWVDVVSSICKNTGSRLLDSYRKLLLHRPISTDSPSDEVLLEKTMGCDSTTVRHGVVGTRWQAS